MKTADKTRMKNLYVELEKAAMDYIRSRKESQVVADESKVVWRRVQRGEWVEFSYDPEDEEVTVSWEDYYCGTTETFRFEIPLEEL